VDANRFDTLARFVGSRTSRRLAIGLAAMGLLSIAVPEAEAVRCSQRHPCPACYQCKHHRCRKQAPGAICPNDGNPCTDDVCDETANCRHQLKAPGALCRPASCTNGVATQQATCDGNGTCPNAVTHDCAPYTCSPTAPACLTGCGGPDDCIPTYYCNGGVCAPKKETGESCTQGFQCFSTFCVDSVCCATQCDQIGQTCPGGTCSG
jgi:hypothetical protein